MIEALAELGPDEALIITMPPRHSKTESVKAWIEWRIGQQPDAENMYASYSVRLARTSSRSIRNEIATGRAFPRFFPSVRLAPDSKSATDWSTNQDGHFRAAGVGGSITGMGASTVVIDDPIKGRKAAESETVREGVWEWFTADLMTRLAPGARLVLMHTRWHPEDLAGKVLAKLQEDQEGEDDDGYLGELGGLRWKHLNLPALAEEDDPLGRLPGEPLWPKRFSLRKLLGMKSANEYDFESMYQQRPRLRGGTIFLDKVLEYDQPQEGKVYVTVDTASSKRQTADFSVFTAWSVADVGTPLARADVLECRRARLDIVEFEATARDFQARYGVPLHIEDEGLAKPIIQHLQGLGLTIIPVKVSGDKYTRALPYAAAWNTGRVRLPQAHVPWKSAFRAEHLAFTGTDADTHDDQVDTGSLLWSLVGVTIGGRTITTQKSLTRSWA